MDDAKTMFEIYRDPHNPDRVDVVYFTELEEHERDRVLARIGSATSIFRGFLKDAVKDEAKACIAALLADAAAGDLDPDAVAERLRPYLA